MSERHYNYTFAELIDRLSIVQLKAIFIIENSEAYNKEIEDICYDLDLLIKEKNINLGSKELRALQIIMLSNRFIWENESKVRASGDDATQEKLLKLTHSINGVRNTAKNIISAALGERVDLKIDCLAAELVAEFGNWNINY